MITGLSRDDLGIQLILERFYALDQPSVSSKPIPKRDSITAVNEFGRISSASSLSSVDSRHSNEIYYENCPSSRGYVPNCVSIDGFEIESYARTI